MSESSEPVHNAMELSQPSPVSSLEDAKISNHKTKLLRSKICVIFYKIQDVTKSADKDAFNRLIQSSVNEFLSIIRQSSLPQDELTEILHRIAQTFHRQDIVCVVNASICIINAALYVFTNSEAVKDVLSAMFAAMKSAADSMEVFRPKYGISLTKILDKLKVKHSSLESCIAEWILILEDLEKKYAKNKEKRQSHLVVSYLDLELLDRMADVIEDVCKLCGLSLYIQLVAFEIIHKVSCQVDLSLRDSAACAISALLLASKMSSERHFTCKLKRMLESYQRLIDRKPILKSRYDEDAFKDEILAIEMVMVSKLHFEFSSRVMIDTDSYLRHIIVDTLHMPTDILSAAEKILESREYKCSCMCLQFSQGAIVSTLIKSAISCSQFAFFSSEHLCLIDKDLTEEMVARAQATLQASRDDLQRLRGLSLLPQMRHLASPSLEDFKVTPGDPITPSDQLTQLTLPRSSNHTSPSSGAKESKDSDVTIEVPTSRDSARGTGEFFEVSFKAFGKVHEAIKNLSMTHKRGVKLFDEKGGIGTSMTIRAGRVSNVKAALNPFEKKAKEVILQEKLQDHDLILSWRVKFSFPRPLPLPNFLVYATEELLLIERGFGALILFKESKGRVIVSITGPCDVVAVQTRLIALANSFPIEFSLSQQMNPLQDKVNHEPSCCRRLMQSLQKISHYSLNVRFFSERKDLWSDKETQQLFNRLQKPSILHVLPSQERLLIIGSTLDHVEDAFHFVKNHLDKLKIKWRGKDNGNWTYGYRLLIPAAFKTKAVETVKTAKVKVESCHEDNSMLWFELSHVQFLTDFRLYVQLITSLRNEFTASSSLVSNIDTVAETYKQVTNPTSREVELEEGEVICNDSRSDIPEQTDTNVDPEKSIGVTSTISYGKVNTSPAPLREEMCAQKSFIEPPLPPPPPRPPLFPEPVAKRDSVVNSNSHDRFEAHDSNHNYRNSNLQRSSRDNNNPRNIYGQSHRPVHPVFDQKQNHDGQRLHYKDSHRQGSYRIDYVQNESAVGYQSNNRGGSNSGCRNAGNFNESIHNREFGINPRSSGGKIQNHNYNYRPANKDSRSYSQQDGGMNYESANTFQSFFSLHNDSNYSNYNGDPKRWFGDSRHTSCDTRSRQEFHCEDIRRQSRHGSSSDYHVVDRSCNRQSDDDNYSKNRDDPRNISNNPSEGRWPMDQYESDHKCLNLAEYADEKFGRDDDDYPQRHDHQDKSSSKRQNIPLNELQTSKRRRTSRDNQY